MSESQVRPMNSIVRDVLETELGWARSALSEQEKKAKNAREALAIHEQTFMDLLQRVDVLTNELERP